MKAMVLAAGLGTRLRAMTTTRPKALVQIGDRTLLEITLMRLRDFGVTDVIVNVHHFAEMIVDYLKAHDNFGLHIEISREDLLLDTGGGLKKAGWFFMNTSEAFILHNVDVISTIDLARMIDVHRTKDALATLAVQKRESSRYLIFDEQSELCGWRRVRENKLDMVRSSAQTEQLAFAGIHVISPRLIPMITESGTFSIIPTYLRLAGLGERILGFRADDSMWRDLGTPENVAEARREQHAGGVQGE